MSERELHRLPDREAGEHGERRRRSASQKYASLLQRVVLSLARMILAHEEIELHHLDASRTIAAARHEIAPLAVQVDEAEVDEAVDDEHPHHGEVPVARAGEPAAERQRRRESACCSNG